jgi:hypothetical protein
MDASKFEENLAIIRRGLDLNTKYDVDISWKVGARVFSSWFDLAFHPEDR